MRPYSSENLRACGPDLSTGQAPQLVRVFGQADNSTAHKKLRSSKKKPSKFRTSPYPPGFSFAHVALGPATLGLTCSVRATSAHVTAEASVLSYITSSPAASFPIPPPPQNRGARDFNHQSPWFALSSYSKHCPLYAVIHITSLLSIMRSHINVGDRSRRITNSLIKCPLQSGQYLSPQTQETLDAPTFGACPDSAAFADADETIRTCSSDRPIDAAALDPRGCICNALIGSCRAFSMVFCTDLAAAGGPIDDKGFPYADIAIVLLLLLLLLVLLLFLLLLLLPPPPPHSRHSPPPPPPPLPPSPSAPPCVVPCTPFSWSCSCCSSSSSSYSCSSSSSSCSSSLERVFCFLWRVGARRRFSALFPVIFCDVSAACRRPALIRGDFPARRGIFRVSGGIEFIQARCHSRRSINTMLLDEPGAIIDSSSMSPQNKR